MILFNRKNLPRVETGYFNVGPARLPYSIERSKRRRRTIGLMIGDEGHIRVLAPMRTGLGAIERLVHRQQNWIHRRIADHRAQQNFKTTRGFGSGDTILFQGQNLSLRIGHDLSKPQGCQPDGVFLGVNFHAAAITPDDVRLEILLWYKKQARRIFEERTQDWSRRLNLRYRRLAVSNPQRLWGSCSARDEIRLNWRLVMAPPELMEYVIVHELCHIAQKNHSRRFWRLVEDAIPDCMARRKRLRQMTSILNW